MNMPPECDCEKIPELHGPCGDPLFLTVFNKSKSKYHTVCEKHLRAVLVYGSTYVVYPAKDYSKHANGHDLTADHSRSDHGGINGA